MDRDKGKNWRMESIVDSLSLEIDRLYDKLAIKGVNRNLAFSVKELSLDLNVFPSFDGKYVRFRSAESGDEGASKLTFQLGSITGEQIRRSTVNPISKDDIAIEEVEDLDEEVKLSLRKHGIRSSRDLMNLEIKNVDLDEIVKDQPGPSKTSYRDLAEKISRARRTRSAPSISGVTLAQQEGIEVLTIAGENLVMTTDRKQFPVAVLDGERIPILSADVTSIQLNVDALDLNKPSSKLQIALDPFAVVAMNLNTSTEANKPSE